MDRLAKGEASREVGVSTSGGGNCLRRPRRGRTKTLNALRTAGTAIALLFPTVVLADEGGVSFWLPGLFGSLAAVPQAAPGWSLLTFSYYTNVSAGSDVSAAREIQIGRFTPTATANLSANLHAQVGLEWVQPNYTFATPVLGGQATVGMGAFFGRSNADLAGTLTTTLGPLVSVRTDNISSAVTGFGDLYPIAMVKWHDSVNNYMVYATGDIPVGAYDPNRLANLGDGHGAIDAGGGYTYFNPQTGHELSASPWLYLQLKKHIHAISERRRHASRLGYVAVLEQAISGRSGGLRLQGNWLR